MRTDSADNAEQRSPLPRILRVTAFTVFILLAAYLLLLVIWVIGAGESEGPSLLVDNQHDEPVQVIYMLMSGKEIDEFIISPGESLVAGFPCTRSRVARTDDGRLVDQWKPPPDCSGDQHWVITQSENS